MKNEMKEIVVQVERIIERHNKENTILRFSIFSCYYHHTDICKKNNNCKLDYLLSILD